MATTTIPYKATLANHATEEFLEKADDLISSITPRICMIRAFILIVLGLGVPLLMLAGVIPATLLFGFVGFALTGYGAVKALICCGEI